LEQVGREIKNKENQNDEKIDLGYPRNVSILRRKERRNLCLIPWITKRKEQQR